MNGPTRRVATTLIAVLAVVAVALAAPQAAALSSTVVISQVYGGGGNTAAPYKNDFIELFNRGTVAVDIGGWSVQYGSSGGTIWTNKTNIPAGTILQPGQYYLIAEGGGANGVALPTPDTTGTISMSASAGKVALVNNTTALTGACPTGGSIVDFVGFGTAANCSETSPTGTLSNTMAAIRGSGGCTETDNNSADFAVAAPTPRNSASPANSCSGSTPTISVTDVTAAEGNSGTTAFVFQVTVTSGTATFDVATSDGSATTADGDYAANQALGATVTAGTPYLFTVLVNGDTTYEPTETFNVTLSNVQPGTVAVGKGTGIGTITNDDAAAAEIFEIQGSGAASPYAGQIVTTSNNVVTAVGPQGFFIQTPDARADASPDTSNGIYVYTNVAPTVAVGDLVNVTGTVTEYYTFTEFSPVTSVTVLSSGNPLPTPVELGATVPPTDPAAAWYSIGFERLEGMLVHVASGITSGPNKRRVSDTTAEIYAVGSPNRPFREPGVQYPGLGGLPVWDGNPEIFLIDADFLGATPDPDAIPAGTPYTATGVMGYDFGFWELWPTSFVFAPPPMPRAVRARASGEFTVGTYNLLQLDAAASDYATRLQKHSAYIRTVLGAPDVLGVEECMSITELNALGARIHADDSSLNYTAYLVEGHDVGGIDVGLLVKDTVANAVVTQLGYGAIFAMDGSFLHDRPPLLLEADYVGNGAPFAFTVMVNHTRSLNGIDDPVDGDRVRRKRLAQALWIAQAIQDYQTAHPTRPFAMVGDLNAYEVTDGYVDVVGEMAGSFVAADNLLSGASPVAPALTKQALNVAANDRYSYNYDGTAQVLDHALTTQATSTWVRGFAYGRGNADAALNYLYDASTPLRSSDHDGAVLFLMSDANANGVPDDTESSDLAITTVASPSPVPTGGTLTYTLTVANTGSAPAGPTTVTDTLPAGVSFVSASGSGWTCGQSAGVVTCNAVTMPVGTAPSIVVTSTVVAASGTLTGSANVSSFIPDPNTANNTATSSTVVLSTSGITATKAVSGTFGAGSAVAYTIVLTNSGTTAQADNPGNELVDVLPAGLTLVSATATSGTAVATPATNTVTWNGSIPAGGTVTVTVVAAVRSDVTAGTTISNQATISYDLNGDGTNEATGVTDDPATPTAGDATGFAVAAAGTVAIPTLGGVGLGVLALLVALGGALVVGRRLS